MGEYQTDSHLFGLSLQTVITPRT